MTGRDGRALRALVLALVVGGWVLPIVAGVYETARAAFGVLPAIGATTGSLDPWRRLASLPGVGTSVALTLWTGIASTLLSLLVAVALAGWAWALGQGGRIARVALPVLAAPHAAVAIGLAFLIAPSGWIARIFSPWATGWQVPPSLATVHDPAGMALILGLMVKEVPFLFLMILSALTQIPVSGQVAASRALGYRTGAIWSKVLVPQIYPLVRLPVLATLVFALSVVDMAIVLGPTQPPTLAVAMTRWFVAADSSLLLPANAAALLLAGLAALSIGFWIAGERIVAEFGRRWIGRGSRGGTVTAIPGGASAGIILLVLGLAALIGLLAWSLAWRWPFPSALPERWSLAAWSRTQNWVFALKETLFLGLVTTAISLALSILWLEGEARGGLRRSRWAATLIYLPLLIPQGAFLFGLSVAFLRGAIAPGPFAVIWGQALFVFPYVMLALSDPWHAFDARLDRAAAALGAGPWRRLFRIKLPILMGPILMAAAIGFAVSVAQYLPTLLLGAGRVVTLTTEAVALSSGADRRITGVFAMLLAALPLIMFGLALALPALLRKSGRQT